MLHYDLPVGLLRKGDPADFIVIDNPQNFNVLQTYLNGNLVAENGQSFIENITSEPINNFDCELKTPKDFAIKYENQITIPVIETLDGQLITLKGEYAPKPENGLIVSDILRDILKIVVVNRYQNAPVATAFIKNFGLKIGAIASSVAHDSHNIIAVGVDDESICDAVNLVIGAKGGVSAVGNQEQHLLELPIAGLMSGEDGYEVANRYAAIDQFSKKTLGSTLNSPFMSLSFMALLVIPKLKLSDLGLFDGESFSFKMW